MSCARACAPTSRTPSGSTPRARCDCAVGWSAMAPTPARSGTRGCTARTSTSATETRHRPPTAGSRAHARRQRRGTWGSDPCSHRVYACRVVRRTREPVVVLIAEEEEYDHEGLSGDRWLLGTFEGHVETEAGMGAQCRGLTAEEAIEWGRARAGRVVIRLGDSDYYSAGAEAEP